MRTGNAVFDLYVQRNISFLIIFNGFETITSLYPIDLLNLKLLIHKEKSFWLDRLFSNLSLDFTISNDTTYSNNIKASLNRYFSLRITSRILLIIPFLFFKFTILWMLTRLKQIRFRNDFGFLCLLSSAHKYSSLKNKKLRSKLSTCNYRAEYWNTPGTVYVD